MDSNTHSTWLAGGGPPDDDGGLGGLIAAVNELAAQDRDGWSDRVRARRLVAWRRLLDRQEGLWLQELADLDARGAAGADQDQQALSTAAWLRNRLRLSVGAARSVVRTARALFRGPFTDTAAALVAGEISLAHAKVVAEGTSQLPEHAKLDADPVLAEAARRLDPPRLRQAAEYLCQVADPEGADRQAERRYERRGLWLSSTWDGMVAVDGLLEPEAGEIVQAALEPLARPGDAGDERTASQRTADALTELARRVLEAGGLPKVGGVRPQLLVTVDLDSLQGGPGSLGGELGWGGPLAPEACRRLACDGTVTRVVVSRQPASGGEGASCAGDRVMAGATSDGADHDEAIGLGGCGPPWPGSPGSWAAPPPGPWRSAGRPGSSRPPNATPWLSATAAVSSQTAIGPRPGLKPII
jgi:hypothetical protein